jgi:Flp pilus assembly protein protease CpaA
VARLRRSPPPHHIPYACAIAAGTVAAFLFPVPLP